MIWAFAVIRAVHFASLMTVFGAGALLFQAKRFGIGEEKLRGVFSFAALLAFVTTGLWLGFVSQEMTGDAHAFTDIDVLAAITTKTFYGQVFVWRIGLIICMYGACMLEGAYLLRTIIAGSALALIAANSHATAAGAPRYEFVRAAVDAAHLLAAGFWVGGLAVLVPEVLANDVPRLVALLRLFSRWGVVSVAVLIAAGTANGVFILDTPMRWSGLYIGWLAVKIVLAAAMVALALTNRFGVLPGLARGDQEAEHTIPLTVVAELVLALLILLIVGFLGLTAPMEM